MEQNKKLHPKGLDSNKSKMLKSIKLETKNTKNSTNQRVMYLRKSIRTSKFKNN